MEYEGSPELFVRLRTRRDQLSIGRLCDHIKPILIVLSGTNRGAYGGGQVTALEAEGYTSVFAAAVGVSTGAPTAAYFLAGQAAIGTTIYHEECTQPEFIDFQRGFRGGHYADVGWLADGFRGQFGHKTLKQSAVRDNPTELLVGVTRLECGSGVLVDAKTIEPDVVTSLHASIAIPGMYRDTVAIQSLGRCLDGAVALPFPVAEVLERYRPTDVLVLANQPKGQYASIIKEAVLRWMVQDQPEVVRTAITKRHDRFRVSLATLRQRQDVHWGIIWTDHDIDPNERRPERLAAASARAREHMHDLLKTREFVSA